MSFRAFAETTITAAIVLSRHPGERRDPETDPKRIAENEILGYSGNTLSPRSKSSMLSLSLTTWTRSPSTISSAARGREL